MRALGRPGFLRSTTRASRVRKPVLGVDLDECACYREAQSLALAGEAAAVEIGLDVIFLGNVEQLEGLLYDILQYA